MSMKWWTENLSTGNRLVKRSVLGLVCLALAVTSGCSLLPKEGEEEDLPIINPPRLAQRPEYVVRTETLETKVRAVGKIMAVQEEDLVFAFPEGGNMRVAEVYVRSGEQVQRGQLIAELDVTNIQNQLREKQHGMRQAELDMIRDLKDTEMDPFELERRKTNFEKARLELVELQEQINRAKLLAPFEGTIVTMNIRKGDNVQAYASIGVIADMTKLTVAANLSADDLTRVAPGMDVVVDINAAGQHAGKVDRLPVQRNNQNQNPYPPYYPPNQQQQRDTVDNYLLVELNPFPESVTRGTPLSVQIITNRKENAVVIPLAALRNYGGRYYVQVVDDEGNRREVDVEVGQQTSTVAEILQGLTPGQKVLGR